MGCDIHIYIEVKKDNKWESASNTWNLQDPESYGQVPDTSWEERHLSRNYSFFGLIAGVRWNYSYSLQPKGLPEDVCSKIEKVSDSWNGDGHSRSYLTLSEIKELSTELLLLPTTDEINYQFKGLTELLSHFDESLGPDQRVIFWFDN